MHMIAKIGYVTLYKKCSDSVTITTFIGKKGKITTFWYDTRRNRRKARQILDNLKSNGCAICGYNKCLSAVDFHHVIPETKNFSLTLHRVETYSNENITEELNKCILLCCRCHREIHFCLRGEK